MVGKVLTEAVAYIRTSSATNVGADKDSDRRQREAITAFARRTGYLASSGKPFGAGGIARMVGR